MKVFDGKSDKLSANTAVLVVGDKIEKVGGDITAPEQATVIDAGGRVLMPGLIDAHWHAFMAATPQMVLMTAEPSYLHLLAARQAEATLMRGFTTVRDCGGPVFGLKRAIDEGVMKGPRIYPSGAFISQTSGHGDFRWRFELPRTLGGPLSNSEVEGVAAIADSPDEVRLCAREQLRKSASQIKVMAGGGVASPNTHKGLAVKRKYFPRPRGFGVSLTPFLRGHSSGGEDAISATRLGYRKQARLLAPQAEDEPHPTLMRTPAAPLRGARRLCQGTRPGRSRYSFVPDAVASRKRRAHLRQGRGQLGKAHGRGGSSGDGSFLGGRGPVGVGWTLGWRFGAKPALTETASRRSRRVPRPTPGPRPVVYRRGHKKRARPASHSTVGLPGLRPRTCRGGLVVQ